MIDAIGLLCKMPHQKFEGQIQGLYLKHDDAKFVIEELIKSIEDDTELTPSKQVLGYIEGLLDSKDWDENDPVFKTLLKIQEYIRPIV